MYQVSKRMELAGAHFLPNHPGKCRQMHGHNWIVVVHCEAERLNEQGMVVDFGTIKEEIHGELDHVLFNNRISCPTAENIAKYICDRIGPKCSKVEVIESGGNTACYIR